MGKMYVKPWKDDPDSITTVTVWERTEEGINITDVCLHHYKSEVSCIYQNEFTDVELELLINGDHSNGGSV